MSDTEEAGVRTTDDDTARGPSDVPHPGCGIEGVKRRIKEGSVVTGRPIFSRNGGRLSWLLDLRSVLLDRACLVEIAAAFWAHYADRPPFQIGTIETAAIPLLTALILLAPEGRGPVNGFVVRKERKTSGLANRIEGEVTDQPIVLVDDSLNSGGSIGKAFAVLEAEGRTVRDLAVVVDFRSETGLAWRDARGVTVWSPFTLDDFGLRLWQRSATPAEPYRTLWHTKVEGGLPTHVGPKSAPVLVGDRIFRGSDAGSMQSFDAATGELVWSFRARAAAPNKGIWSTPAVHEGRLYFGAYDGSMYCLDAATGAEVWSRSLCDWIGASPLLLPHLGLVCVGLEHERPWARGALTALRMADGETVWERTLSKLQHGSAAHWPEGDLVIWGSADHETLALRAATGEAVWSLPTRRSVKYAPAVDGRHGVAAFASFDNSIYLADLRTGAPLAEWETGGICYTTPLILGDRLFCGSGDRKLYIADVPSRKLIARLNVGARVFASPVAVGDRVVFGTTGGKVVEIDAGTLRVTAITQLPDAVTNAVAVSPDGRRVYASTAMNDLFALERA